MLQFEELFYVSTPKDQDEILCYMSLGTQKIEIMSPDLWTPIIICEADGVEFSF